MAQVWSRVKIPRIVHECCGYKYDSKNTNTVDYFRCFAHKTLRNSIYDTNGILRKVKFCITIWLVCKNNECITSFTYFYDYSNHEITKIQTSGLKYILSLKDKFLENIPLKVKIKRPEPTGKKYLWRYTDKHPTKNLVSNIYNLDDKKVGETPPQQLMIYFENFHN